MASVDTRTKFADASLVKQINSHTYNLDFPQAWAIGSVPNGGFVTSCIIAAARLHFRTTRSSQSQPDCMILHLEFPRRTSVGPATLTIQDLKLGRQTSTVHVTLAQSSRVEVVGYLTFSNLALERGLSLPTDWRLVPAPAPADLAALAQDQDRNYVRKPSPWPAFRQAGQRVHVYYPRAGMNSGPGRGGLDHWLKLSSGEKFTVEALGFVADVALQVTEGYMGDVEALQKGGLITNEDLAVEEKGKEGTKALSRLWYPTLVLNLELKKKLPEDGVDWLFTRVVAKVLRNGRMDLEVYIIDSEGDLVALSHHVCMILDASRNTAARGGSSGSKSVEKL